MDTAEGQQIWGGGGTYYDANKNITDKLHDPKDQGQDKHSGLPSPRRSEKEWVTRESVRGSMGGKKRGEGRGSRCQGKELQPPRNDTVPHDNKVKSVPTILGKRGKRVRRDEAMEACEVRLFIWQAGALSTTFIIRGQGGREEGEPTAQNSLQNRTVHPWARRVPTPGQAT